MTNDSELQSGAVIPPTPWQEGYMAGRVRSSTTDEANQYREQANRDEFLRGFEAGSKVPGCWAIGRKTNA